MFDIYTQSNIFSVYANLHFKVKGNLLKKPNNEEDDFSAFFFFLEGCIFHGNQTPFLFFGFAAGSLYVIIRGLTIFFRYSFNLLNIIS